MPAHILTEVRAELPGDRDEELLAGFAALLEQPLPDGLLRTELLRGDGVWRIQTLWRDRNALDAMRASGEPPAAPALFRRLGAEPSLTVLAVVQSQRVDG